MFRYAFGSPCVCLLGLGMVACATASGAPELTGSAGNAKPGLMLDLDSNAQIGADTSVGSSGAQGAPPAGDDSSEGDETTEEVGACDCGASPLPGVTIGEDGKISIAIPGVGTVGIKLTGGSCHQAGDHLNLVGDVSIDVPGGGDIPLLDADIDVTSDGGLPGLAGSAKLDGGWISAVVPGGHADGDVTATVSLARSAEIPGAVGGTVLGLAFQMGSVGLPPRDIPALRDLVSIRGCDVLVALDGAHKLVAVQGTIDDASRWLDSRAPIVMDGVLDAGAMLVDGTLRTLTLSGDMSLVGRSLICGLKPIASVDLSDATLVIDGHGLELSGQTAAGAALNPTLRAGAQANVKARIGTDDFYVRVCASASAAVGVLDINVQANADAAVCLALTPNGTASCSCGDDGASEDGACDGDGASDGDGDDTPSNSGAY